ncbi:hypothetical protein RB195_014538 [Necator americanus]|uniref:Uncharacterized protein n=1 Tax=Necator americanus TaxID=51031 RepID=A0ABR1E0I9_NECAM
MIQLGPNRPWEALASQGVPNPQFHPKYSVPLSRDESAMRGLEWDDMGVKVDGRHLHHSADDIVLITSRSINQAGRMLAEFDETRLKNRSSAEPRQDGVYEERMGFRFPSTLNGTDISECSSYVYPGREINMMNDLTSELCGRKRAVRRAFEGIEDVVKQTNATLHASQEDRRSDS